MHLPFFKLFLECVPLHELAIVAIKKSREKYIQNKIILIKRTRLTKRYPVR